MLVKIIIAEVSDSWSHAHSESTSSINLFPFPFPIPCPNSKHSDLFLKLSNKEMHSQFLYWKGEGYRKYLREMEEEKIFERRLVFIII